MSDSEQDEREGVLPFPEVYIKVEPQDTHMRNDDEVNGLEDDLEEGYGGVDMSNSGMEEDLECYDGLDVNNCEEMPEEDFEGLDEDQDDRGEDGDMTSEAPSSDLMQEDLSCALCQKEFSSPSSLKAHMSKKHKLALGPCFTCHLCGAIGQTKATLKRHLLRTHGQGSLMQHQMLRKCQHCEEGFVTQEELNTHISEAHSEVLSRYQQCPYCTSLFATRQSVLRHIGRRHPGADASCLHQDECQECHMTFPSRTQLRLHNKTHHPESLVHKCDTCLTTFKYSYLLRRHIKNIHEKQQQGKSKKVTKRYKCLKCPREYRSKSFLDRHTLAHLTPKKPRMYTCTLCKTKFTTRSHRARHLRLVHWDKTRPKCSECNKEFKTMDELNDHRQVHRMSCHVCEKTFLRRDSLREHLLIHNGPKLPCPYCPKSFTQSSNLKRHIRIHTGEKPYKCSFCTKRFGDKSACNSHMRVHTGAERCSCPVCGASFSKRQKLNYHMRKHTGEGLMHCPLCSKSATDSYSLKKHLETHQTVLTRLLQGAGVMGKTEDCQRLALRTLHNLAWVTARATPSPRSSSNAPPRHLSPLGGSKVEACKEEMEDVRSTDGEAEKTAGCEEGEGGRTAIEHIEVNVKVEVPDEVEEVVDSSSTSEGIIAALRQLSKIKEEEEIKDPLGESDNENNEVEQHSDIKPEVLSYIMTLRCAQFNEAVKCALAKYKLEAAIKEGRDSEREENSERRSEENDAEDEGDDTKDGASDAANRSEQNKNNKVAEAVTEDAGPDETDNSPVTDEPMVLLARMWRLIIGQMEEQRQCERVTTNLKTWLRAQETVAVEEADNDTGDLSVKQEPEDEVRSSCVRQESNDGVMESEASECEEDNAQPESNEATMEKEVSDCEEEGGVEQETNEGIEENEVLSECEEENVEENSNVGIEENEVLSECEEENVEENSNVGIEENEVSDCEEEGGEEESNEEVMENEVSECEEDGGDTPRFRFQHYFDMSRDTLFSITANEDLAVKFLQQRRCIRRNGPSCSICDRVMTLIKGGGDKRVWRCPTHKGEKSSLRLGSFWENAHLPFRTLVRLAFLWSFDVPNKTTMAFTGLAKNTVIQWFQYFRDVCSHHLLQNPIMIGGPNVVVEVESVIAKRKYPERWVFGGVCPDTHEGFLVFVPSRDAATLLPIIQQHVRPGSIIHTDGWAAYNGIAGINVQPAYIHQTVNHTVNSVDPITGACTNHVENYWKRAKAKLKAMCGVQENFVESYLDEFLWRERFGGDGMDTFDNLLLHISQWYPTP